jgi:hypothetical protein
MYHVYVLTFEEQAILKAGHRHELTPHIAIQFETKLRRPRIEQLNGEVVVENDPGREERLRKKRDYMRKYWERRDRNAGKPLHEKPGKLLITQARTAGRP